MRFRSFLITLVSLPLFFAAACQDPPKAPEYAAGREACLQASTTCQAYAACVAVLAAKTGGPGPLPCADGGL